MQRSLRARLPRRGLRHIVLAHLSETCNEPRAALDTVKESLLSTRFAGRLTAAAQDKVLGPFEPGARRSAATQLSLGI